jgi:hypothetical protein
VRVLHIHQHCKTCRCTFPVHVCPERTRLTFRSRAVPPMKDQDLRVPSSVYSVDQDQRNSRVASSLYSQPSPTYPPDNLRTTTVTTSEYGPDDVSPISTPRSIPPHVGSDSDAISPIESTFAPQARAPLPDPVTKKSQIPRPVSSIDRNTPPSQRSKKADTKWDEYSGEPTAEDTGKRGSVQLGGPPLEMQFPQLKERTKQILAGLRERDASTKKPVWGKPPPPVDDPMDAPVQQRPAWKGASGREATVEPVRNTPTARKGPLYIPQRNVSRSNPVADQARAQSQSPEVTALPIAPEPEPIREPSPVKEVSTPRAEPVIRLVSSQESVKPVAPLKTKNQRVKSITDPGSEGSLQSPFQSPPQQPHQKHERSRTYETNQGYSSPVPEQAPVEAPSTPVQVHSQQPASEKQNLQPPQGDKDVSRFSWTTYATTVNDSPSSMQPTTDNSPVPPMPPMPQPITIRKRPVSTSQTMYTGNEARFSNASLVSRKPVGDRIRSASTATMQSSKGKDLPPTPQEMQAGDKIAALEAKQNHLLTRKRNNSRIRAELSDSLKRNAITYDMYKRKEVESRIKELEEEMQEIHQEEHDVGVQLHRAQKKRDKDNPEQTSLWISRVTA